MSSDAFFDTSVLLPGLVDLGAQTAAAQQIFDAIAEGHVSKPMTAWHCCLEFYSVLTRLPEEYRLDPADALRVLHQGVLRPFEVHPLPTSDYRDFFEDAARSGITGGRIYDAHIAEIARSAGARVVVTDNRRHFTTLLPHGIRVVTAEEFAVTL